MSIALTSVVQELHATAARRLIDLINTQTDPALLARLIATALRFKVPIPKGKTAADGSSPQPDAPASPQPGSCPPPPLPRLPFATTPEEDEAATPHVPSGLRPLDRKELTSLLRCFGSSHADRARRQRLRDIQKELEDLTREGSPQTPPASTRSTPAAHQGASPGASSAPRPAA